MVAGVIPALKATGRGAQDLDSAGQRGWVRDRVRAGYSVLIVGEVAAALWFLAMGSTMAQPVVQGRNFTMDDLGEDRSAVIVNEGFVERVLEGRYPSAGASATGRPGGSPAHGRTRSSVSSGRWA